MESRSMISSIPRLSRTAKPRAGAFRVEKISISVEFVVEFA